MAKVKRIFMAHGLLRQMEQACGLGYTTISRYLKGYYDEDNKDVAERAEKVRAKAMEMGGVIER